MAKWVMTGKTSGGAAEPRWVQEGRTNMSPLIEWLMFAPSFWHPIGRFAAGAGRSD